LMYSTSVETESSPFGEDLLPIIVEKSRNMIHFVEDRLDIDTYLELRRSVNFKSLTRDQARKALDNSLYILVAYQGGKAVGMGRIVWGGGWRGPLGERRNT